MDTKSALGHIISAAVIIMLTTAGLIAQQSSAPSSDNFTKYRTFLGAASADRIPTVTLVLADSYYNVAYTIGATSSLLIGTSKAAQVITRTTYHNQDYAEETDENGAVSRDDGIHLKDLRTVEALITGRIAFDRPVAQSPMTTRVVVPGGWPVDLRIAGNGLMWEAIIHGTENHLFRALKYSSVGNVKITTNWVLDGRNFRSTGVQVADPRIDPPPNAQPDWQWLPMGASWSQAFVPYGNRPMIPISVNGVTSLCILDSGTGGIVLPLSLAAKANIQRIALAPVNGPASVFAASYGRADITVGPAELRSAVVIVGPRSPGDYAACGYDFLASFVVHVAKRTMTIAKRPVGAPPCDEYCVPVDTWEHTAVANIRVGSVLVNQATLDTGLDGSLVLASSPLTSGDRRYPACDAHLSTVESLIIGPVAVGLTPTCYAPLDATLDPTHRAQIGSAVLLRYRLELDLGNHEVRLDR
ncbi:MAG: retropepsin-like aspartic protease [Candidatus Aquilonibacter sp.]